MRQQGVNDKTPKFRQKMVDAKIPAFGAGYNTNFGQFHYINNSGNIYPGLENKIASGQQGISNQIAGFSGLGMPADDNWSAPTSQFVGQSPLAQKTTERSGWLYGAGVGLYTIGNMGTGGELFLGNMTSFFNSMNEYSAPVELTYTTELNKLARATRGVKLVGGVAVVAGGILDFGVGVPSYYRNGPIHPLSVSPTKASVNLGVGAYSLYVNPAASPIYFGYELFYPGGFRGASEAATEAEQGMMQYPWYNYFNKQ